MRTATSNPCTCDAPRSPADRSRFFSLCALLSAAALSACSLAVIPTEDGSELSEDDDEEEEEEGGEEEGEEGDEDDYEEDDDVRSVGSSGVRCDRVEYRAEQRFRFRARGACGDEE